MKKFLLSCFLAMGISASAQLYSFNSFETTAEETGWVKTTSGFTPGANNWAYWNNTVLPAVTACMPSPLVYGGVIGTNGGYADFIYNPGTAVLANGEAISVSAKHIGFNNPIGTLSFAYSTNSGTTWTDIGTATAFTTTCGSKTGTIANGIVTSANSSQFRFRVRMTRTGTAAGAYFWIDELKLEQTVTAAPNCTVLTSPANGATGVSVRPNFTWGAAAGAQSYKLYVGTTAGGTDIVNGTTQISGYIPAQGVLAPNTTYYVKVVPTNTIGDATGCTETTFTTGANAFAPYCGPLVSTSPPTYPISSVTFTGITKTSAATTGSTAHEDFTSTIFAGAAGISYPLNIIGTGATGAKFHATVFIDWNNDGDFGDAGESYFTTYATSISGNTATNNITGNVSVPSGTTEGNKRMRIKYNFFSGTADPMPTFLTNACEDFGSGQVEDYTFKVDNTLAVSDINKSAISVYPNPFTDVLKISDVKGVKSVSVNDISGREVKSLAPSAELNLSSLKAGLYIVSLKMEDGSVKTFKAIKK